MWTIHAAIHRWRQAVLLLFASVCCVWLLFSSGPFFPLFCFCPLLSLWLQRHQRQGAADVKLAKLDCGGWYYLATVEKIAVVGLSCPVLRGLVLHCSFPSCLKLALAQLCSFLFAPAFSPSRHVLILLLCSPQFCCVPLSPAVISSRQLSSLYIFHIYILSPVILLLLISSCQCCSPPLLVIWLQRTETYTQTSMLSPYKKKKKKNTDLSSVAHNLSWAEYHSGVQKEAIADSKTGWMKPENETKIMMS